MRRSALVVLFLTLLSILPAHAGPDDYLDRAIQVVCVNARGAGFQMDSTTVVTARHVVENCLKPTLYNNANQSVQGTKVRLSATHDLAYITVPQPIATISAFANVPVTGSDVYAVGSPIDGLVLSKGTLQGLTDDDGKAMLILKIPADQGNSGGPVFSVDGLVGIVISKNEDSGEIYALTSDEIQSDYKKLDISNTTGQTVMTFANLNQTLLIQVLISATMTFVLGLGLGYLIGKRRRRERRDRNKPRIRIELGEDKTLGKDEQHG